MLIKGVVIPADTDEPMRLIEFERNHLATMQSVVGGLVQATEIERPDATLWGNEEGKLLELPINRRAVALLWIMNSAFRNRDFLVGNVLLTGPADTHGETQSAPQELIDMLLGDPRLYQYQVQTIGDTSWSGNALKFDNWMDAHVAGILLAERWSLVEHVRVVVV